MSCFLQLHLRVSANLMSSFKKCQTRLLEIFLFLDGYLPKEGKEIAKNLGKFKYDLEHVAEFTQRPLPAIAIQALNFVFWATLIVGTLDNSHKFMDRGWYLMPLVSKRLLH